MKEKIKKRPPAKEEKFIDEDDDKRIITFVSIAILVIIGIIIGLMVGCQKEEKNKEPDIVTPSEEEKNEDTTEEVANVVTTVTKTSTKREEKKSYMVTFYYNGNMNTHRQKVEEGSTVNPYLPAGFESCHYYYESDSNNEVDFSKKITSDTEILMECSVIEYEVIYDEETDNPKTYTVLDGTIALEDLIVDEGMFVGWYSDSEFKNRVVELSQGIISLANSENKIYLYAKIVISFTYNIYDDTGKSVFSYETDSSEDNTPPIIESVCTKGGNLLGWTNALGNTTIIYEFYHPITLTDDIHFYPVCGSAVVIYESADEVKVVGYTDEELATYVLPDAEDLGLETPTYFVPVETPTETSKLVVEDDRDYVADNEVKLGKAIAKAAEGYTPQVGDNVEEYEKEFEGWTTEDTNPSSDTFGEQIEVPADYTPPADTETTLEAVWTEPVPYDISAPV